MNKLIPKFLKIFQEDLDSFYEIFDNLDQGETVNISGLENVKVLKYLKKMFKYLKLKKNDEDYSKNPELHTFDLKKKIKELTENSFFQETSSSSSSENEDDEIIIKPLEIQNRVNKPKEAHINVENFKKIHDQEITIKNFDDSIKNIDQDPNSLKKVYGVQFISPEEKEKFLRDSIPEIEEKTEREDWIKGDNVQNIIDSSFGKLKESRKPQNSLKNVPKYLQSLFDKEPDKIKYLSSKHQETDEAEQNEVKEYMKTYDLMHSRGKSLLEIHKEKIKEKKKAKGGNDRKPFNRDTDLKIIRHDSKKIFSLVNEGDNSLINRFKNSKWEKSFL